MPEVRIGIQLASLGQPWKKAIQTAADLGARAVELDARGEFRPSQMSGTAVRQIRKMLEDCNLTVCAMSFRTHRGYNVLQDLQQRVDATKAAMSFAHDLGAPVVINQVGRVPDEPTGPDWDLLVETLADLGRHGQRVGALLAAETGSEDGPVLAQLVDALPAASIGVNLDPGNLIINGFSAVEAVTALGPHILHVHAKDGVRDLARGRGLEVPLGRGSADFPALLGALEERQYRGYFTIEREKCENPVAEIGFAVQYLRNI